MLGVPREIPFALYGKQSFRAPENRGLIALLMSAGGLAWGKRLYLARSCLAWPLLVRLRAGPCSCA